MRSCLAHARSSGSYCRPYPGQCLGPYRHRHYPASGLQPAVRLANQADGSKAPAGAAAAAERSAPTRSIPLLSASLRSAPASTSPSARSMASKGGATGLAAATAAAAAAASAGSTGEPRIEPEGMEREARLLSEFAAEPSLTRAIATPGEGGGLGLTLCFAQRDLPGNCQRRFNRYATLAPQQLRELRASGGGGGGGDGDQHQQGVAVDLLLAASPAVETKDVVMYAPSPSGRRALVVRSPSDKKASSALLEVWEGDRLVHELAVPGAQHGPLYNDGWFGTGACWSPDERRVVYVAERPAAVQTPKWTAPTGAPGSDVSDVSKPPSSAAPRSWQGVGEWEEDWGELNVGKRPPAIYVLDTGAWTVSAVQGLPEGSSCGQPVWTPEGNGIVFVAWPHLAHNFPGVVQRLGVVYCFNRPAALWAVAYPYSPAEGADGQPASPSTGGGTGGGDVQPSSSPSTAIVAVCLTPGLAHAASPVFSPGGGTLAALSSKAAVESGVHSATVALVALEWKGISAATATSLRTVVDVVDRPKGPHAFPGLYCSTFIPQPFIDEQRLALTTAWRSTTAIVEVDMATGCVQRVSPDDGASAWALHSLAGGVATAVCSRPNLPYQLQLAPLGAPTPSSAAPTTSAADAADSGKPWPWTGVRISPSGSPASSVTDALAAMCVTTLQIEPTTTTTTATTTGGPPGATFEAVVIHNSGGGGGGNGGGSGGRPQPGILVPHGGPHAAYAACWMAPLAYLHALGYALVLVNYRGSTGFGEESLQSLPGNIGTNDVADCMAAVKAAADAGLVDASRVCIVGGSHGGFLTGNLVGQHPSAFKAGVMRNPVCDLSAMVHISDIPDWTYIEAWGTQEGKRRLGQVPSAEDLARFREVSPMAHVQAVTTPLMLMLGEKDERVPLEDGKRYAWALRSRRDPPPPPVRVLVFPEDTHALDRPQTEFEAYVNIAWWCGKHLRGSDGAS